MHPLSLVELLTWIEGEYRARSEIFGVHEKAFWRKKSSSVVSIFGESCGLPVGPAAGPHTQMAQNIIASYLSGARYFELKTVQHLEALEIEKPCIDARDEAYNTEWSTELTLDQAFDEYLKAWLILPILEDTFDLGGSAKRAFVFNMSVGYDLAGIKSKKLDSFISAMYNAATRSSFGRYLEQIEIYIRNRSKVLHFKTQELSDISPRIVSSVTLSTMHGCPADEILTIGSHLLDEKKLNLHVKLNPNLLGASVVQRYLHAHGFGYINVDEETYSNDLQYRDALKIVKKLQRQAMSCERGFGVKVSNTLKVKNEDDILPGEEKYLSGRALAPLTIRLACKLAEDLAAQESGGGLQISYAGGVTQRNILELLETGLAPVTVVTDLLKPGGYLRLAGISRVADEHLDRIVSLREARPQIDVLALRRLEDQVSSEDYYKKHWCFPGSASVRLALPLTDCYIAPCVEACPISQDVPGYIALLGAGDYDQAIELIYRENPLPHITGHICDHQCMYHCTRIDYEGPVLIREMKRIAAMRGTWRQCESSKSRSKPSDESSREDSSATRIAVIGAGPSGLAAAYFLARDGCTVHVFEKEDEPGGVITHVLPHYRISKESVLADIAVLERMDVTFHFNARSEFVIDDLKQQGFSYIYISIGAQVAQRLTFPGGENTVDSLSFLRSFNLRSQTLSLGRRVAVIGGGNTAMDSARTALKVAGVESVNIIYRRTESEMPADREEFENALREGAEFKELLNPVDFSKEGVLVCQKMRLGAIDESGRKKPISLDEWVEIPADTVISALGEEVDISVLRSSGLPVSPEGAIDVNEETLETSLTNVFIGGDAFRGGSTVVQSIADARRVCETIIGRISEIRLQVLADNAAADTSADESASAAAEAAAAGAAAARTLVCGAYPKTDFEHDDLLVQTESTRCLQCNRLCNKCVEVCPNRANAAIPVRSYFRDACQIVHIDALCNGCGNCETFCPYDGAPYREKLTLFAVYQDYVESENSGFVFRSQGGEHDNFLLRINKIEHIIEVDHRGSGFSVDKSVSEGDVQKAGLLIQAIVRNHPYLLKKEITRR